MKHIYILCLALSSFFIYHLATAETYDRYAFFMPQGALQQNTLLTDLPQIEETKQTTETTKSLSSTTSIKSQPKETAVQNQEVKTTPVKEAKKEVKKSEPKKQVTVQPSTPEKQQISLPVVKKVEIVEIPEPEEIEEPEPDTVTRFTTEDLDPLLRELADRPKGKAAFQKIYENYVNNLRIYLRKKKLPTDSQQEKVLAKANTLRRFNVQ
jgi:hypothetical protein